MTVADWLPLVPALPLLGVVVLTALGGRLPGRAAAWLATALVGGSFLLSAGIGLAFRSLPTDARGAGALESPTTGAPESPAAATGPDSSSATDEHGATSGPAVIVPLWSWMSAGDDMVRMTMATKPLAAVKDEVTADAVGTLWMRLDVLEQMAVERDKITPAEARQRLDESLARMWDPGAVVGHRVMQDVDVGTPLTVDNVPPAAGMAMADAVAAPGYRHRFAVDVALLLDGLSLVMILVVTGVGFLIHLFSIGYMAHDADIRRYFVYLNLFVFSMLVLVLGADFLVMFVGWELVGACSFLLIGFWYRNPDFAAAGRKAFIVNRVGDFAFLLGLMLIWTTFGSLAFADVFPQAAALLPQGGTLAVAIAALLLAGATGKSAQVPLYVWLPDAMAGPTPVSALIHAATMVTAGVYLIARAHALFEQAPAVQTAVAVVGAATALLAALIAVAQVDIKRVLAYSTISQLGYMFLGVGAGAYAAGVFHLVTHAFFKALLFLGAGSIMHAMEHGFHAAHAHGGDGGKVPPPEDGVPAHQDMRRMGGLLRRVPLTGWTFVVGGLALAGVFPLAGFWSKDEILAEVLRHGGGAVWPALYGAGLFTAFLTAFYTGRQLLMVLAGPPRSDGAARAHESPAVMTVPLLLLALMTLAGGALAWVLPDLLLPAVGGRHGEIDVLLAGVATVFALAGLGLAWLAYGGRRAVDPDRVAAAVPWAYRLARGKFYVDELYIALFVRPFRAAADFLWRVVDDDLVDGAVNGLGRLVAGVGQASRRWQTGYVRQYALSMLLGVVVIVIYLFMAR